MVIVEQCPDIDFTSFADIQYSTTLSSIKSIQIIGQHVTVKAKVTNMSGDLTEVNCTLRHPTASGKMVLGETFTKQVLNDLTYMFHNVTVCKDRHQD